VEDEEREPFIALIPGGGWMIWHADARSGWSDPVVAWALCANGDVIPLEADGQGQSLVWPVEAGGASDIELWHPDSSSRRAQDRLKHHRNELDAGGS
jgi:hypothetical protein